MKRILGFSVAALLATTAVQAGPVTKKSVRASAPAPAAQKGQGAGERDAQLGLPQSKAPVWATLRRTRIGEDAAKGVFTASFPAEVKAMNRTAVTLTGFMLPLDAQAKSRHFLLSRYTPVCFFCPPGEPNEVVEVFSAAGMAVTDRMIQVSGRFALQANGEQGLFFRIDNAQVR